MSDNCATCGQQLAHGPCAPCLDDWAAQQPVKRCAWCLDIATIGDLCDPCEQQRTTDVICDYAREDYE